MELVPYHTSDMDNAQVLHTVVYTHSSKLRKNLNMLLLMANEDDKDAIREARNSIRVTR